MITELVEEVKKKKELRSLDYEFVKSVVDSVVKTFDKDLSKKKHQKEVVKESRRILREVYGAFKLHKFHKANDLVDEISSITDLETHDKVLSLHTSTKERLPFYSEIYLKIFSVTGNVNSVLDLGCGLNPISYPYMNKRNLKYYATELTEDDAKLLNKYFSKLKIKGEAFALDLTIIPMLPKADVCFMFKLLDTLETIKKNVSKELVHSLNVKWLVVSFPTRTLGGKNKISKNRLSWFKQIIKDYKYEEFEVFNEVFFIVKLK
ncbi:MAG: hypothetical protein ABIF40_02615 [archaeon]